MMLGHPHDVDRAIGELDLLKRFAEQPLLALVTQGFGSCCS